MPLFLLATAAYFANEFGVLPLPALRVVGMDAGHIFLICGCGLAVGAGAKSFVVALLLSSKVLGLVAVVSLLGIATLYGCMKLKGGAKAGE